MDAPRLHDLPDEWAETLATALVNVRCSRPIETAGGFLMRCGSRRVAVCPSCAEMVRGAWAAIARSGVFDPPAGKRFRLYVLTLTASSFGSVHAIPNAAEPGRRRSWSRGKSAAARNPLDGSVLRWGAQSKCDALTPDGDGARGHVVTYSRQTSRRAGGASWASPVAGNGRSDWRG